MSLSPHRIAITLSLALCLLGTTGSAAAGERASKLDRALRQAARARAAEQRVIIQTRPGASATLATLHCHRITVVFLSLLIPPAEAEASTVSSTGTCRVPTGSGDPPSTENL